ncbi:MAG: leucine-rich repeat protein [Lachnospiraceae bacterium]|nr:leucine-rich repeat protein [Lachnospiraceae bacterium]
MMKRKSKSLVKCITTFILTAAMVLSAMPLPQFTMVVRAEEAENTAPVVDGIPGESINEGGRFAPINLDRYVTDEDQPSKIQWTASGYKQLRVSISPERVATIEIPSEYWNGSEDITFTATDTKGAKGSETVNFNVESVNNVPTVRQIPDQTIDEGKTFAKIWLDDYVNDLDHPKNRILWECVITPIGDDRADGDLSVVIDPNRVASIVIPDPDWYGSATVTFKATDPDGASAASTAKFTVNTQKHNITIRNEITASVNASAASALPGATVTLTLGTAVDASTLRVNDGNNDLTLTDIGNRQYTFVMPNVNVTVTAGATIDLSEISGDVTAIDKDVLTGSTSHTVTIADGADITLSGATINGGIVCDGTADITLVGDNSVTGADLKAGIQLGGLASTLTIKGNGTLSATGGTYSAGIGLNGALAVDTTGGDIVIKGGTITATGGSGADGIGIGTTENGCTGTIGTLTVYHGLVKLEASGIKNRDDIVYMFGTENVSENNDDYFDISEISNALTIISKHVHSFDYSASGATVTAACSSTVSSCGLTDGRVTLTISAADATYNGSAYTGAVIADKAAWTSLGLTVPVIEYAGRGQTSYTKSTTAPTDAGTYTASITVDTDKTATVDFEITKAGSKTSALTPVTLDKAYTLTSFTTSAAGRMPSDAGTSSYAKGTESITGNVSLNSWSVDSATGTVTVSLAGAATGSSITLPVIISSQNYEDSTVNVVVRFVERSDAGVSIAGGDRTAVYGEAAFTLSGSVTAPGEGTASWSWSGNNTAVATVSSTGVVSILKPGTAVITAKYESETTIGESFIRLTVNKAVPAVTAPVAKNLTYNGESLQLVTAGSSNYGTLQYSLNGRDYSDNVPAAVNAGSYTVYYRLAGTEYYEGMSGSVTAAIARKDATVTAEDKNKTEGGADPSFTASVSGVIGNDVISYNISRASGETSGTYVITPAGDTVQGNYTVAYRTGTLTITPKPVYTANVVKGKAGSGDTAVTSGSYEENAVVTITADAAPDGQEFDRWTGSDGVEFADAASTTTTFKMPAKAVTVTATYKNKQSSGTTTGGGTSIDEGTTTGGGTSTDGTTTGGTTTGGGTPIDGGTTTGGTTAGEGTTTGGAVSEGDTTTGKTTSDGGTTAGGESSMGEGSANGGGPTDTAGTVETTVTENKDGSTTTTTVEQNSDGSTTTKEETVTADGTTTKTETVENADGSTVTKEETKTADGTVTTAKTKENADGSLEKTETVTGENGEVLSTTETKVEKTEDGLTVTTESRMETGEDGQVTTTETKIEESSDGTKTTEETKVETGADGQVTTTETKMEEKSDGSMTASTVVMDTEGEVLSATETERSYNSRGTEIVESATVYADGSSESSVVKTTTKGKVVAESLKTEADGSGTLIQATTKSNGDSVTKTYDVSAKGKVKLTSYETQGSTATIPESVESNGTKQPVSIIGAKAFAGNTDITKVKISSTIDTIGKNAFKGASNLKSVLIYSLNLKKVSTGAFADIAPNAVIKIQTATKKEFDKAKALIEASGLPEGVKVKRIKK